MAGEKKLMVKAFLRPSIVGGATQKGLSGLPSEMRQKLVDSSGNEVPQNIRPAMGTTLGYLSAMLPPPLNPNLWHNDDLSVWDYTQVNQGERIQLYEVLEVSPGLFAIQYDGNKIGEDNTVSQTGGNDIHARLAWTTNFVDWYEYGSIFDTPTGGWEGSRTRGKALVYDETREKWFLFYGGNGGAHISGGERAWGVAYSEDITGPYTRSSNNPIVEPDHPGLTDWVRAGTDVVYVNSVNLVDGVYYACVMAGTRSNSAYDLGILTATDPEGPWTGGDWNPIYERTLSGWTAGINFGKRPIFVVSEQKWYMPIYNGSGEVGFLVSANSSLTSEWAEAANNPIITVPNGSDGLHPLVVPLPGGTYACFATVGDNSQGADKSVVKMITSHVKPTSFPRPIADLKSSISGKLAIASNLNDLASKETAVDNLLSESSSVQALMDNIGEALPITEPAQSLRLWRDPSDNTLKVTPPAAPVLSGFAYPGETITSTEEGQWKVDGSDVSGETGTSFVVRNEDIGKDITQVSNGSTSNTLTVWHPADVSGVELVYLPFVGTLKSGGSEAGNAELIETWEDQTANGWDATQTTSGEQPQRRTTAVDTYDSILFGSASPSDELDVAPGALGVFRNKSYGYIIAAANDSAPSGGNALHYIAHFEINGSASSRFALSTKFNGDAIAISRIADGGGSTIAGSTQVAGWQVLTAQAQWADGTLNLRRDGSQVGTASFGSSSNTPDTDSNGANIGSSGGNNYFPGNVACVICASGSTDLSATDLSRLERFAGLLIGKDIPLA